MDSLAGTPLLPGSFRANPCNPCCIEIWIGGRWEHVLRFPSAEQAASWLRTGPAANDDW